MRWKFLVAEDVRQEASGKGTVVGLFADDVVVVQAPADTLEPDADGTPKFPAIDDVALLVNVSDVEPGTYRFRCQMVGPQNAPTGDIVELGEATIERGGSHSMVLRLKPFVLVQGFGTYKLSVWCNDTQAEFPIFVRRDESGIPSR